MDSVHTIKSDKLGWLLIRAIAWPSALLSNIMKQNIFLSCLIFSGSIAIADSVIAKEAVDLKALGAKLKAAVIAGEMTREEAMANYKAAESGETRATGITINGYFVGAGKDDQGQHKAGIVVPSKVKDKRKWPKVTFTGESLTSRFADLKKGAVVIRIDDGLTRKASDDKSAVKKGGKVAMRKKGGKGGAANFYSIVIGRMKSKDIELGEFTMEVDYATVNRYGSLMVRDEIMGKTVKVTGVSGQFRDNLLLIRKGQTLKVRTSGYSFETKTLSFAHKFNVLERAVPFSPDAHGVPPEAFRGFAGTLKGKILESSGYELLMVVDDIASVADANEAADPKSIKGKRVRVNGFFNDYADQFNSLLPNDIIRVGMRHRNTNYDMFEVTDVLEVLKP